MRIINSQNCKFYFTLLLLVLITFFSGIVSASANEYEFLRKKGSYGTGNGQFNRPENVKADLNGNIYVVDTNNHRVQKFDASGNFILKWGRNGGDGTSGSANGEFSYPFDITIDPVLNRAFVSDTGNNRIQVFDLDGNHINSIYGAGTYTDPDPVIPPYFASIWKPYGLARNPSLGWLYITGWFERHLKLVDPITGAVSVYSMYVPGVEVYDTDGVLTTILRLESFDPKEKDNRIEARGIAVDFQSRVFIANSVASKVDVRSMVGTKINEFGSLGSGDGNFNWPSGIDVDDLGNVYVADKFNHRIQIFKSDGVLISKIGKTGKHDGEFSSPAGVGVDPLGRVFVADTAFDRLQTFRSGSVSFSNLNEQYTSDRLNKLFIDNLHAYEYAVKNQADPGYSAWQSIQDNDFTWDLGVGEGLKTVLVQVRDRYQNIEDQPYTASVRLDTIGPAGSIGVIASKSVGNVKVSTTKEVDLVLYATDGYSGIDKMRFSNDPTDLLKPWTDWEDYGISRNWTLSDGEGLKTVYAQFKDKAGNISSNYSINVWLDSLNPMVTLKVNNKTLDQYSSNFTKNREVLLNLDAADNVSATGDLKFRYAEVNPPDTSLMDYSSPTSSYVLSDSDGLKTIWAEVRDQAGNTTIVSNKIILDRQGPTGTVKLSSGSSQSTYTKTRNIVLDLSGIKDSLSGMDEMSFSNNGTTWTGWDDYEYSKSWTLTAGEGDKVVYCRFKDNAGNTRVITRLFTYDTTSPKLSYISSPDLSSDENNSGYAFMVKWNADDTSGIKSYDVQVKVNTGTWQNWAGNIGVTKKSAKYSNISGNTYYFRFRATDKAGNASGWSGETSTVVPVDDRILSYTAGWSTSSGVYDDYYQSTARISKRANAYASYVFQGKGVYLLGAVGPYSGIANVYINGSLVAKIDLYAPAVKRNKVVFTKLFSATAKRTIKIVVTGGKNKKASDSWVDIDGLGILK